MNISKRTITLALLIITSSSISANSYIKPVAAIATAGIASYLVGPWLYSYVFPTSDAQVMEQALADIKKSEIVYNNLAFSYHNELEILDTYAADNSILKQLKPEIYSKHSKYPWFNYIKNLNREMKKIKEVITSLSSNRITIAERKLKLYDNNNITATQLSILQDEYDLVIANIKNSANNIDELQKKLAILRSIIAQSNEYIMEAQQIRIEELEHHVYYSDNYSCSHDSSSWSRPTQTVYVHTQPQPQVNVTYCDSWSCPSETVYVSAPAPAQAQPVTVNNNINVTPSYTANNTSSDSYTTSNNSTSAKTDNAYYSSSYASNEYSEPTMTYDSELWCDRTDPFNN